MSETENHSRTARDVTRERQILDLIHRKASLRKKFLKSGYIESAGRNMYGDEVYRLTELGQKAIAALYERLQKKASAS